MAAKPPDFRRLSRDEDDDTRLRVGDERPSTQASKPGDAARCRGSEANSNHLRFQAGNRVRRAPEQHVLPERPQRDGAGASPRRRTADGNPRAAARIDPQRR